MKNYERQTLHIENPSKELLQFFRKLREEKEEHKAKQIAKKIFIFQNISKESYFYFKKIHRAI